MWIALALLTLTAAPPPGPPAPIEVGVSEQVVLQFPGLTRIAVGDPAIADVHVASGGEVLLTGKAVGDTTLVIWRGAAHEERQVHVTQRAAQKLEQLLRALAPGEDLRVEQVNGKQLVTGHLHTYEAYQRLLQGVKGEPGVVLMVEMDRSARAHVVDEINAALDKAGLNSARAVVIGSKIFLEGQVPEEADRHRAQLIAESIAGAGVESLP